jgi:hypothetical protein
LPSIAHTVCRLQLRKANLQAEATKDAVTDAEAELTEANKAYAESQQAYKPVAALEKAAEEEYAVAKRKKREAAADVVLKNKAEVTAAEFSKLSNTLSLEKLQESNEAKAQHEAKKEAILAAEQILKGTQRDAGKIAREVQKMTAYVNQLRDAVANDGAAEGPSKAGPVGVGHEGDSVKVLPPAHLTGGMEAPAGEKTVGSSIHAFYTEEQQARLGVDENGDKVGSTHKVVDGAPPAGLGGSDQTAQPEGGGV